MQNIISLEEITFANVRKVISGQHNHNLGYQDYDLPRLRLRFGRKHFLRLRWQKFPLAGRPEKRNINIQETFLHVEKVFWDEDDKSFLWAADLKNVILMSRKLFEIKITFPQKTFFVMSGYFLKSRK